MKKIITTLVLAALISLNALAQEAKPAIVKQFLQINTVESVLAGGLGRSRMIITNPDGSQQESEMENLFSMTGINFKNIKENESKIIKTLKGYTDDGWKVDQVTSLTLSQNDTGSGGIFMTRYLLSKETEKKGF
ncbi:MAG: hypothetical protein EOO01_12015 [Chitinophagaceae bacterium]|nr:MAG: hypothetical protein EOO01_12015 [Chitinophagaceae bacterium]